MKSIKDSFSGVIIGILFIIAAACLLWFNESNNVKNIKAVDEGRKVAINIENSPVNTNNNGKLVNIKGDLVVNSGILSDNVFNIKVDTSSLSRVVEVYQWEEVESEDSNGNKVYDYNRTWSSKLIDSNEFNNKTQYVNPISLPYESQKFYAEEVSVGDFKLTELQKAQLETNASIGEIDSSATLPSGYVVNNKYITSSSDVANPQIGDIRISYFYNDYKRVTILGKQEGNSLIDYTTESDKTINEIRSGEYSASQMFDYLEKQNNTLKWALRGAGELLMVIGFLLILGPISTISGFIPIIGSVVGVAVFAMSFFIGTALSLIIIAISWIVFRPILGISLIGGACLLIILLKLLVKKKNSNVVVSNGTTSVNNPVIMQSTVSQSPNMGVNNNINPTTGPVIMPNATDQSSVNSSYSDQSQNNQIK